MTGGCHDAERSADKRRERLAYDVILACRRLYVTFEVHRCAMAAHCGGMHVCAHGEPTHTRPWRLHHQHQKQNNAVECFMYILLCFMPTSAFKRARLSTLQSTDFFFRDPLAVKSLSSHAGRHDQMCAALLPIRV